MQMLGVCHPLFLSVDSYHHTSKKQFQALTINLPAAWRRLAQPSLWRVFIWGGLMNYKDSVMSVSERRCGEVRWFE